MTNTIDILSQNKATSSEVTTNNIDKEVMKDKPSLFDSLLKESLIETNSTEELEIVNKNSKENIIALDQPIVADEIKDEIIDVPESKKIDTKIQSTLLDRLIIEAKNSPEITQNKEKEDGKFSFFDSLVNGLTESESLEDNKVDLQTLTQEELVKTEDTQKIDATTGPILENTKVSIDNKVDLQTLTQEELVKTEEAKETNIPKEAVLEKVVKENIQEPFIEPKILVLNENENLQIKIEKEFVKIEEAKETNIPKEAVLEIVEDENKTIVIEKLLVSVPANLETQNNNELPPQKDTIQTINNINSLVSKPDILTEDTKIVNNAQDIIPEIEDKNLNVLEPEMKTKEKKSLMDLLIQKNIEKSQFIIKEENPELVNNEIISKDFISSMYLGTQKNLLNNQLLFNRNEAINILKNGTSIKDVEKSADLLDLSLENIDFVQDVEVQKVEIVKKQDIDILNKKNLLDNLLNEKNVKSNDIRSLITKSVEASSALLENNLNLAEDVNINVNAPLSYNIQSKIIGAKQQMSTMMSDIARQMYENYKPPVSVFRINLNPLELGSIAIMMKSDKNNALSISMNISNNTTLEALVENQNILRNSLNKTFDENTKFNLDFSSSNQNNNQSSNNQNNNQSSSRFENQGDTQTILQMKEENKDREEKILDYM